MRTDTLIRRFGARLHALRTEKHLSQEALASRADLNTSFISALEGAHKEPSLSTLEKLAKGLNVRLTALVDFEDGNKTSDRAKEELALILSRLQKQDLDTLIRVRKAIDAALG